MSSRKNVDVSHVCTSTLVHCLVVMSFYLEYCQAVHLFCLYIFPHDVAMYDQVKVHITRIQKGIYCAHYYFT